MPIIYVYPDGANEHGSGGFGIHGTVGSLTPFGGGSMDDSTASGVTISNPTLDPLDPDFYVDTAVAAEISPDFTDVIQFRVEALVGPCSAEALAAGGFTRLYDPQLWWTGSFSATPTLPLASTQWIVSNWETDTADWATPEDHTAIGVTVYHGSVDVYSLRLALELPESVGPGPVVRLFPRDDGRGMSSASRIHPLPKGRSRIHGGYQ